MISPKSLFVSLPKKPLCLNVLPAISLPQSSYRQRFAGGPLFTPPWQSCPSGGVSVSG